VIDNSGSSLRLQYLHKKNEAIKNMESRKMQVFGRDLKELYKIILDWDYFNIENEASKVKNNFLKFC
jgi:hypothetical protein